jgi:uncharacterized protein (DUF2062 family)
MPRRFFSRISKQYRRNKVQPWYLRPFRYVLEHPVYFSPSRRSVGGGLWLGIFFGLLPIPGQTAAAILGAFLLRVNVPVAAITVWISNPLTFVPIFYLAYRLGAALMNIPPEPLPDEFSIAWLGDELALRWKPLVYGSFIMALSAASSVYLLVSAVWHVSTIYRYRRRHQRTVGSIRGGSRKS